MRGISLFLGVGTAAAWLSASFVATAQEPAAGTPPPGMTRAQLEAAGATIRAIYFTVDNVFDPSNPDEDKALYRWANRVHVRTRDERHRGHPAVRSGRPVHRAAARRVGACAARAGLHRRGVGRARQLRRGNEQRRRQCARARLVVARARLEAQPHRRPDGMGHRALRRQPLRHRQDARGRLRERDRPRPGDARLRRRQRVRQPRQLASLARER